MKTFIASPYIGIDKDASTIMFYRFDASYIKPFFDGMKLSFDVELVEEPVAHYLYKYQTPSDFAVACVTLSLKYGSNTWDI